MSKLQEFIYNRQKKKEQKYSGDDYKVRGITSMAPTYINSGTFGTAAYGVGDFNTKSYKGFPARDGNEKDLKSAGYYAEEVPRFGRGDAEKKFIEKTENQLYTTSALNQNMQNIPMNQQRPCQ